jgi:hypothetical protein
VPTSVEHGYFIPDRPTAEELAGYVFEYWGGGGGLADRTIDVNLTSSTLRLAAGAPALRFRRASLLRATQLLERMGRDASMGFVVSGADVRELHGLLDPTP